MKMPLKSFSFVLSVVLFSVFHLSAVAQMPFASVGRQTGQGKEWVDEQLAYCDRQVRKTLQALDGDTLFPRSIDKGQTHWKRCDASDWTSGFWPGILWYDYENRPDTALLRRAWLSTERLRAVLNPAFATSHDIGFQLFCSYGNAYRLTGDKRCLAVMLKGAKRLAELYNPRVGTILSWPDRTKQGWPHNTIIDNMMNLQLLFFAARHGGPRDYFTMAVRHADRTMAHQFRPDGTSCHVALYDSLSGQFIRGITNQGYSDSSFWARGQAWGIYGFTVVYRETRDKKYLHFVEKIADAYLSRLPQSKVPYWDFDAPDIPHAPRDASAAAIVSSALLSLSQCEDDKAKAAYYFRQAEQMLASLSTSAYQSRDINDAFLLHSVGNMPGGYEIDASINYADYYYLEALTRYRYIITH